MPRVYIDHGTRDKVTLEVEPGVTRVTLHGAFFRCTNCGDVLRASDLGLRRSGNTVRNQPQCKECRKGPRRKFPILSKHWRLPDLVPAIVRRLMRPIRHTETPESDS